MWYLITFERSEFIRVKIEASETDFTFTGKQEGIPTFNVKEPTRDYTLEIIDNEPEGYYLSELQNINPRHFIFLNHAAVIIKWDESLDELEARLHKILDSKDVYYIVPLQSVAASNHPHLSMINKVLNSLK